MSGLLAAIVRAAGGDRLVASAAKGQVLGALDCARWLAADPHARSCRAAALSDWAAEAVYHRLAVGGVGLLVLAVLAMVWRRRDAAARTTAMLPALAVDTAAFILFLLAGVWTLGSGIDTVLVACGEGPGNGSARLRWRWLPRSASAAEYCTIGAAQLGRTFRLETTPPPPPHQHQRRHGRG